MSPRTARFCILHIALAVASGAAWWSGLPVWPDGGLAEGVSVVIIGLLGLGVFDAWRGRWDAVDETAQTLPMLAIVGTAWGFIIAFQGYSEAVHDAASAVSSVAGGMAVSLHATMLGIGSSLWLRVVRRVVE